MTVLTDSKRRVVPRWRPFRTTLPLGELDTTRKPSVMVELEHAVGQRKRDWHCRRDIESAIDLVHTAAMLNQLHEVNDAVEFVLSVEGLPDFVKQTISAADDDADLKLVTGDLSDICVIADLKIALRTWPRDAILWTDLALRYCVRGLEKRARRCLRVALSLAPKNRYVLRCATRFFVHVGESESAMDLLHRSVRTRHDPWLASAEIAASQVAGRTPTLMKAGKRLLESKRFSPSEITELSASLGTVEVETGKIRRAKKLFEKSVISPNDNVKAQFSWLSNSHEEALPEKPLELDGELDNEARALARQTNEDWIGSIECCRLWGLDEPFSDRPFTLGSYIAIEALGNAPLAQELAEKGLSANSKDIYLLNNLAVSLAIQGKTNEAERRLKAAKKISGDSGDEVTMLKATEGMLHFRQGNIPAGRQDYIDSIRLARARGDLESARRAALYFVMEEVQAGTVESMRLTEFVLAKEGSFAAEARQLCDRIRKARRRISAVDVVDETPIEALGTLIR